MMFNDHHILPLLQIL